MSRHRWLVVLLVLASLAVLAASATGEQAGSRVDPVRAGSLDAGDIHSCAILASGAADCWGSDGAGQLGDAAALADKPAPTPVALTGQTFVALSAGEVDTCAILGDGSVRCWGSDTEGQLGDDGIFVSKATPVVVALPAGRRAVAISTGPHHACAVLDDGSVRCWGGDSHGELGDDANLANRPTPVPVALPTGRRAVAISAGGYQACAILDDGGASCWGSDASGQLGDDATIAEKPTPVAVALPSGRRAVAITNGQFHTCAILDNGSASCWGSDFHGQLGNGDDMLTRRPTPVAVALPAGRTAVAISAGSYHTCAILDDGSASCWGDDAAGQLGDDAPLADQQTPVAVALPAGRRAVAISAGGGQTCAGLDDGSVRCWGYNGSGELGGGGASTRQPVAAEAPPALAEGSSTRVVADLSIVLEGVPAQLTVGVAAPITVRVVNAGPDQATGIRVLLATEHVDLSPLAVGQGTVAGGTWQVGRLAAGAQTTLTLQAVAALPGTATLTSEIVGQGERDPDSTPANGVPGEDDQATAVVAVAAAAGPIAPAPAPPAPPVVTPAVRARVDRLTLRLSTRRDRSAPFTVIASGQLLASSVAARAGCIGTVVVTGKAATGRKVTRTLISRRVKLKLAHGTCTYAAALRVTRKKRARARQMTIAAAFGGNTVLLSATAKRTSFRLG